MVPSLAAKVKEGQVEGRDLHDRGRLKVPVKGEELVVAGEDSLQSFGGGILAARRPLPLRSEGDGVVRV